MIKENGRGFHRITCDSSACMAGMVLGPGCLFPDDWIQAGPKHYCSTRCQSRDDYERSFSVCEGRNDGRWPDAWPKIG
jgi:hypothetical protein